MIPSTNQSKQNCACAKKKTKSSNLHKNNKLRAVPLDVAPERRTKRWSPRFRPGGRFWSQVSDTCRQAVRERNVGPQTMCDRSLSSTQLNSEVAAISLYMQQCSSCFLHLVPISVSWYAEGLTIALALQQKHSFQL